MPLQKNQFLTNDYAYACFTILFIVIGLTIVASSMNLLVLRLATINAEEQLTERLEQAEARQNQVRLEGDVISRPKFASLADPGGGGNKQPAAVEPDAISVCSCACMNHQLWSCHSGNPRLARRGSMGSSRHRLRTTRPTSWPSSE